MPINFVYKYYGHPSFLIHLFSFTFKSFLLLFSHFLLFPFSTFCFLPMASYQIGDNDEEGDGSRSGIHRPHNLRNGLFFLRSNTSSSTVTGSMVCTFSIASHRKKRAFCNVYMCHLRKTEVVTCIVWLMSVRHAAGLTHCVISPKPSVRTVVISKRFGMSAA